MVYDKMATVFEAIDLLECVCFEGYCVCESYAAIESPEEPRDSVNLTHRKESSIRS